MSGRLGGVATKPGKRIRTATWAQPMLHNTFLRFNEAAFVSVTTAPAWRKACRQRDAANTR